MRDTLHPCCTVLPETPEKEYARKREDLGWMVGCRERDVVSQGMGSLGEEEGLEEEVLEKMDGGGLGQDGVRVKVQEEVGRAAGWGQSGLSGKWEWVGEVSAVHCGGRNCLPASVSSFPLTTSCSV